VMTSWFIFVPLNILSFDHRLTHALTVQYCTYLDSTLYRLDYGLFPKSCPIKAARTATAYGSEREPKLLSIQCTHEHAGWEKPNYFFRTSLFVTKTSSNNRSNPIRKLL
jgi:hypothetical protein